MSSVNVAIGRPSSRDYLIVEISAKVKKPKGIRISAQVLAEAVIYKLKDRKHRNPRGFTLKIVWWQNPNRKPPKNGHRDYGSQFERWETLARPLLGTEIHLRKVGKTR